MVVFWELLLDNLLTLRVQNSTKMKHSTLTCLHNQFQKQYLRNFSLELSGNKVQFSDNTQSFILQIQKAWFNGVHCLYKLTWALVQLGSSLLSKGNTETKLDWKPK